jgi:3-oxoacid CoA-transferase subunit B
MWPGKGWRHRSQDRAALHPLTGVGVVDRIITDLAVLDITPQGLKIVEIAPGVTLGELQSNTGVPLR